MALFPFAHRYSVDPLLKLKTVGTMQYGCVAVRV